MQMYFTVKEFEDGFVYAILATEYECMTSLELVCGERFDDDLDDYVQDISDADETVIYNMSQKYASGDSCEGYLIEIKKESIEAITADFISAGWILNDRVNDCGWC